MAILIKQRAVAADSWHLLEPAADASAQAIPEAGDLIVPLTLWSARRDALLARPYRLGIRLEGGDDIAALAADLPRFGVVAIHFTKVADGRGYSSARLLRERYGFGGEVRAIGEVLQDQLALMRRCGFDAFALRADQDPEAALGALDDFSEAYQTSATQPLPLFRRRAAGGTVQ